MLIDLNKLQIVNLADFELEKAGFKHGYYTHLVPKKIVGKDGVERIYWVNPGDGKKLKLTRVAHHRDGEEKDHHEDIKRDHVIESKDLVRFSEGDKVAVTWGGDKGKEGVFRGSLAGPSPRVSVAFLNSKTGKYEAKTMNINHIKLVHRADDTTKKVVERKTVEVTNLKGETILVDRGDYEQYYKDREKRETMQERVAKEKTRLVIGGVYRRRDGRMIKVRGGKKIGSEMSYDIQLVDPAKKIKDTTSAKESRLQGILKKQKYERVPQVTILKEAKVFDEDAGAWKKYITSKPLSADLESGELHKKGRFAYGDAGFRVATKADEEMARRILAEHWPMLEKTVTGRITKYPSVAEGDVTAADIIDGLVKAVASYEPLLDTGGGIEGRLKKYADSYARSEAEKIHEREMSTVRDDLVDDGSHSSALAVSAVDKAAVDEMVGNADDIIASAFVNKHDAIALEEGLADEADMMSWLYGNPQILDVMKRWTGIGVFEASLNKKEAAEELTGLVYNPATMEPYATSTIETYLLPKELDRIKEAFKNEGIHYPEFTQTLKTDIRLREKLHRNRKLAPVAPKDEKVAKIVREEIKKPDHRAKYAAQLIKLGVAPRDVATVMQVGDRILLGAEAPERYHKVLPRHLWESGSKALTAWFKERLPASVFTGKRGLAANLPRRFDVETPIKAAIAAEKETQHKNQLAAEQFKDALARQAAKEEAAKRRTVSI